MKTQIIFMVLLVCPCLLAKPTGREKNSEGIVSNAEETSESFRKEMKHVLGDKKTEEKAFEKGNKKSEGKDSCTPGERFMIECNTCYCPPSGLRRGANCTLKGCF